MTTAPTASASPETVNAVVIERAAPGSAASDTPETEHALHGVWYRGDHGSAIPALCRKLERERNRLRAAIEETLRDNAHLSDGDNCTLIKLKRAMPPNEKGQR